MGDKFNPEEVSSFLQYMDGYKQSLWLARLFNHFQLEDLSGLMLMM